MSKLELNACKQLELRQYTFAIGASSPATLLYASDLHLNGWNSHVADQLAQVVESVEPDLVLLGGDLVDTRGGLGALTRLLRQLNRPAGAIPGNHEGWVGVASVRERIVDSGAHWLPDDGITLAGLSIGHGKGAIACAHDPAGFPAAVRSGARLVLAGHLHGSQAVLAKRGEQLYPGRWFFRWNGDRFDEGGATMLVSRGVNDTLPIRWNCPRDVLVCRLLPGW